MYVKLADRTHFWGCPIMSLTSGTSKWWEDLPLHQTMSMWWTKTSSINIFSADIHLFMSKQLLGLIFGDVSSRPWPRGPPNVGLWIGSSPTSNYVNAMDKNIKHHPFFSWYSLSYVKSALRTHFWGRPITSLTSGTSKCWKDLPLHQTMSMWWSKTSSIAIFQLIITHIWQISC